MGFWGSALYANDSTCDVRNSYIKYLEEGLNNQEAYEKTLEMYKGDIGDQDEPLLWFALAETQWKLGRLMPDVKSKALEWIEKGGCLELWEDTTGGAAAWQKTLIKLKEKLERPLPKERKIRKPPEHNNNQWNLYDVYAYQLHGEEASESGLFGKYIILQKIGEGEHQHEGICMRIQVFDHLFDEMPVLNDLKGLRLLPLSNPRVSAKGHEIVMSRYIYTSTLDKRTRYPAKRLVFLGNHPCQVGKEYADEWALDWYLTDFYLVDFFRVWKGLIYEYKNEGEARYKNPKGKLEGHGLGLLIYDEIFEVREVYASALCKGLSNQAAFLKTVEELGQKYIGSKKESLFWYALADVQSNVGRLLPEVHQKTLEFIARSGGLDLCGENSYSRDDWEEALENLQFKLNEPKQWQCPLIKLRQQQKGFHNRWKINDIYAYQFHGEEAQKDGLGGKYILLQKIGAISKGVGVQIVIHALDCVFDKIPTLSDMERLRILPLYIPRPSRQEKLPFEGAMCMNKSMFVREEENYPATYLTFIGNKQGPVNRQLGSTEEWGNIDAKLVKYYQFWHRKNYETIEYGIYKYREFSPIDRHGQ